MTQFLVTLQILALGAVDRVRDGVDRERGATAVEYGLIVALIAAVIVTIVATLGGKINTAFTTVSNKL